MKDRYRKWQILQMLREQRQVINNERSSVLYRKRWDCDYLVDLAQKEGSFISEYRMTPRKFASLVDLLSDSLAVDEHMAALSVAAAGSKNISVASRVGQALILLGGGRHIEAMRTHGVSKPFLYQNFHRVVKAVNNHPILEIKCNNTLEALKARADAFKARSTHGLFSFCTGAIDGLCITITCPKGVKNQTKYYSGTKKKYCINMQGVCDANCLFIAVTCMHVGSTNDGDAYQSSALIDLARTQLFPFHWNGDNAYPCSDYLVIPYLGVNLHVTAPSKEAFNFWHSQLRITIERCFGIFVQRWGIFWKPIKFEVEFVMEIVQCCCRLHNFVMDDHSRIHIQRNTPLHHVASVNEQGVLENNQHWRMHQEMNQEINQNNWREIEISCAMRERIRREIESNPHYLIVRSHHRGT